MYDLISGLCTVGIVVGVYFLLSAEIDDIKFKLDEILKLLKEKE